MFLLLSCSVSQPQTHKTPVEGVDVEVIIVGGGFGGMLAADIITLDQSIHHPLKQFFSQIENDMAIILSKWP